MSLLAIALASLALAPPPAWIQRAAIPPPIVAWRLADVLGTPVVEGVAVDRDLGVLTVNVVDSRFDPPRVVKVRDVPGTQVRWLRAGRRDDLGRNEIAIDAAGPKGEAAYLLRVGSGLELVFVRTVHGTGLKPTLFSR